MIQITAPAFAEWETSTAMKKMIRYALDASLALARCLSRATGIGYKRVPRLRHDPRLRDAIATIYRWNPSGGAARRSDARRDYRNGNGSH